MSEVISSRSAKVEGAAGRELLSSIQMILLNDLDGAKDNTLLVMGSILLVSRLTHYLTIVTSRLPWKLRPLSMLGTLGSILTASVMLII